MAPPRKRTGPVTAFTYRCETLKWRKFSALAALLGQTPGEIFDEVVDAYLEKNKITIADGGDDRLPHIPKVRVDA